jgi:DNA mismatch repair protein MutL
MRRIHQLPVSVATRIAAGEVIERPASVIKELLENSVDAGSHRIDVDVEQGGIELLRVVDDGCGIVADDLPLAFACHATSKLQSADDLFRIGTLGFRGEALASIGGVAQVTLQSRPNPRHSPLPPGADAGGEISCNGGELSAVRPWNGAAGTRIEVRHLFYSTPVRRKFLRTAATELGHVSEAFTRIALAHLGLHLTLRHNGRSVHELPATASLPDRLVRFFGKELRDQLYEVQATAGQVRLTGWIADPKAARGNAKMQYLFVNGRCIRDRTLGHALQEAYRGLVMVGRYPVAFLFFQMPPDLVDVNVHPTKAEVRFRDSSAMYHLVLTAIRDRLRREQLMPQLQMPEISDPPSGFSPPPIPEPALGRQEPSDGVNGSSSESWMQPPATATSTPGLNFAHSPAAALPAAPPQQQAALDPTPVPLPQAPVNGQRITDKVMQLHDAYIVMETADGMLVIDQHALHERILFEELKRRLGTGKMEIQRLLIPEPIDLPAEQAARVLEQRDALRELGLEVEDFGGGTVLLHGYPAHLGRKPPGELFLAAVDHLLSQERPPSRDQLLNGLLSVMACRAAVKAGDRLSADEIAALLDQRHLVNDSHHCPHGRPTTLLLSRQELDRQFGRV